MTRAPTGAEPIIRVDGLSKHFRVRTRPAGPFGTLRGLFAGSRRVRAVDGVTFEVGRGDLVGYLGPNGAGKSTTLKMLTGLLVPSGGTLRVAGFVPWRDRRRFVARIGAVFGQRSTLWWDLPVIESLELLRHVYRVPADRFRANLGYYRELLELDAFLDAPVRSLSLGQRMRADLTAALLHDPELLFLDEPTIGLDVVAKDRIRNAIRRLNTDRDTTVVLTTHDLSDVQKLCRRVLIIDHGKLLYDGELNDLQERFGGERELVVDIEGGVGGGDELTLPGTYLASSEGNRAVFRYDPKRVSASQLISEVSRRYPVRDLAVREPDVEATVRRIYEERLLEKE